MFHLKNGMSVMGSQSTSLRVDHKLGIQSLKQTLMGAVYTVVHDKENTFF